MSLLWIIERYGDKYPYMNKNDKNFQKPSKDLWKDNPHYRFCAYVESEDYIYFGYWTSPNCFVAQNYQDLNKTYQEYQKAKSNKIQAHFSESDIQDIIDRQWQYLDQIEAEQFYFDSQQVDLENGLITLNCYFPNNSLKSRTIVDLDTGELIYHCHWTKGQYFDDKLQRFVSVEKTFERQYYDKYMRTERTYVKKYKRFKWVVTHPETYKGKILEEIYGQHKKFY